MTAVDKKKKSHIILAVFAFAALVLIMLFANWRSALVREVRFPQNNGVAYIFTRGNHLAAVSHDDKLYVWDWNNLSAKPRIVDTQSDRAALLDSDRVVSIKRSSADTIVITNLDGGKTDRKIPIMAEGKHAYLGTNRNGNIVAVVLAKGDDAARGATQEVMLVDCNAGLVRSITPLGQATGDKMMGMAVSDDGQFVVLTGEKAGQGWITFVNVEQNRVVWAKEMPDFKKVRNAVFSTDGKVIYLRGTDSSVQVLDTSAGKILKKLLPKSENKSTTGDQHVQTLTTSDDGRFMAASISSGVYVWDCSREKLIFSKSPGHKLTGGFAFSPDSKFLATCDSRQGGTIKIWRVPQR